jgi:MSHA type pilus biogenesis protein MshL
MTEENREQRIGRRASRMGWFGLLLVILGGCANASPEQPEQMVTRVEPAAPVRPALPVSDRIAWPQTPPVVPEEASEPLFTFAADDLPLKRALELFGEAYELNLVVDEEVAGAVNVDFTDLSFAEAMSALLDSRGYYFDRRGNLIHVKSTETRTFTIDYIRLVRSGSGSSKAQVNSGVDSAGSGGGGGSDSGSDNTAGAMTIEQVDKVDFWDEVETQLAEIVSESGRLVVNRLAGMIQITDQHRRVEEVARFVDQLNRSIYRQVDIDVKIVQVVLREDYALGIDWSRLVSETSTGSNWDFNINNTVTSPAGGFAPLSNALNLVFSDIGADGANNLTAVITALEEQGDVEVVSQPRIRTLNNQSALIKVGTDRTFFRREQLTDSTSAGSQVFSTDVPQVVTEGVVLAITPQISLDGWITMDVSPVVTRVSSVSEVKDDSGNVVSSAPNLDVSQASSLVRTKSGNTIVIGGLIQDISSDTDRGILGLASLPGVGGLFKGQYQASERTELVMFVTPRLIGQPDVPDSSLVTQKALKMGSN